MARYADRLADIENRYGALNSSEEEDDGLGASPRNRPHYADDAELYEEGEVSQLSLVPTVQDPKLWMLKCKPGLEKELCVSLLQKYFNMAKAGAPLNIKSAYTHEGLKGYFYVEAYKADDVRAGCKGIRDLHWFKPVMVPIKEMVPVLSVESRVADVEIGSWARCKRGTYAGDICKVMDKDEDRVRGLVKAPSAGLLSVPPTGAWPNGGTGLPQMSNIHHVMKNARMGGGGGGRGCHERGDRVS